LSSHVFLDNLDEEAQEEYDEKEEEDEDVCMNKQPQSNYSPEYQIPSKPSHLPPRPIVNWDRDPRVMAERKCS
jgi:hypothetical protein